MLPPNHVAVLVPVLPGHPYGFWGETQVTTLAQKSSVPDGLATPC